MPVPGTFDEAYRRLGPVFGLEPDPVLARLVLDKQLSGRALDLGAGDGRNSLFLAAHGFTVDAVDLSRAAVENLNELASRRRLDIQASVCDLREPSVITGEYDVVVADTVLCHLSEREAHRLSRDIGVALKPGGWLYVSAFGYDDPRESEFAPLVETHFAVGTLRGIFQDFGHGRCEKVLVVDTRHGHPHRHVLVRLIAQKEGVCG